MGNDPSTQTYYLVNMPKEPLDFTSRYVKENHTLKQWIKIFANYQAYEYHYLNRMLVPVRTEF